MESAGRAKSADAREACELAGRIIFMKRTLKTSPKVTEHGEGVGIPSPADIERRASELARIAGRAVSDEDRATARAEFQQGNLPDTINDDAETTQSLSRDPSDPMTIRG